MIDSGWISLHRKLLEKPIWLRSSPEQKCILITLLLMANHSEQEWEWKGERYTCMPGQMITSLEKIAKTAGAGISIKNVRSAIKRFEKYGFLANESTNRNRLITICNYEDYQDQESNERQAKRQAGGKQAATNNNVNNVNKKKKKNIGVQKRFSPPSVEEVKKYCTERENNINPESFVDFYTSNGWMVGKNKMKDWKASVRTWEKRDKQQKNERKEYTPNSPTLCD